MENIENTPKSLFREKEHYLKFVATYKAIARQKKTTTELTMIYSLLRNRDWRKGFTPVTNKNKINFNGRKPNDTINLCLSRFKTYGKTWSFWTREHLLGGELCKLIDENMLRAILGNFPEKIDGVANGTK